MSGKLGIDEFEDTEDIERMRRRKERIRRMKKEKERRLRIQRIVKILIPVASVLLLCVSVIVIAAHSRGDMVKAEDDIPEFTENKSNNSETGTEINDEINTAINDAAGTEENIDTESSDTYFDDIESTEQPNAKVYSAHMTADTEAPPGAVDSDNVVFIDMGTEEILAQRGYATVINPASMTKVLTVLVAAERVTDLDDTFTMTVDITDYSYSHGCSSVGFEVGEKVKVRDLFYGTILPSGGDAAVALAVYVAGSHEEFVKLMNEKAKELGLSSTAHFTNCVGIYNKEHHCTVYDMAIIMEAALDNSLCREILSEHTYTTSPTTEHPEGIIISNWFLRRIEDKDTGGEVVCAKTGYVVQSDSCAVSYGIDAGGNEYVCATAGAYSSWRCIYDHVALYKKYAK